MNNTKYHGTAINRGKPSAPAVWIKENKGFDARNTLDYGCGRGDDVRHFHVDGYDPQGFYRSEGLRGGYTTVLCTYVLNVIPSEEERNEVIEAVKKVLSDDGVAYFSVRADKAALNGWTNSGTYQGFVELDYPIVHRTSGYIIYEVKK
jgi:hypothetical protein